VWEEPEGKGRHEGCLSLRDRVQLPMELNKGLFNTSERVN
jgi:hypothetical protein